MTGVRDRIAARFTRAVAALTLRFLRRKIAAIRLAEEKSAERFERRLAEMDPETARAALVAEIRGWRLTHSVAADLADAVRLGGSHFCSFWRGCALFRRNNVATAVADSEGEASAKLIMAAAPDLDIPLEALKLKLAVCGSGRRI